MFMSDPQKHGRIVNRAELASLCNVSLPTVDAWVRKDCPIIERGSKGRESRFDSAAVIDWRIAQAVEAATTGLLDKDGRTSKDEADRRRAVANAISAEVEADEALKSVVSRFDAESAMADFCQVLRSGLSNAGAKIAGRAAAMTNPNEIRNSARPRSTGLSKRPKPIWPRDGPTTVTSATTISERIEAHRPGDYSAGARELRTSFRGLFASALIRPPRMSDSEWAEKDGRIPKSTGAESGRVSLYGYQRGLLDAMCDPRIPCVTVMKAARVGYTRCFTLAVGYHLHHAPTLCAIAPPASR